MENNNLMDHQNVEQDRKNESESKKEERPISYYENNISANDSTSLRENMTKECKFDQMRCLTTTVPQNISVQNIAGKHTPTRNSLRHSRMIVLHRSGKDFLPPIIRYYKFAKVLLVIVTFLGTVLCTLSVLLLLWTQNIRSTDNPYWSAVPVIFSGITGLLFLYFLPKEYPSEKLSYWINSIKIVSIATSLVAAIASFIVCGFAVVHLIALGTMDCSPPDKVNTSCLCKSNSAKKSIFVTSYHYVDLSCTEVNSTLYIIIIFSCVINIAVVISEVLYLYLHWSSRSSYRYSRIPVSKHPNINKTSSRR